ncbi:MAG: hypothetical protein IPK08_15840 [Bacteroidetes bacterium]|nr:hypothetical protein [Bacteroidota bacterium]
MPLPYEMPDALISSLEQLLARKEHQTRGDAGVVESEGGVGGEEVGGYCGNYKRRTT